MKITDVKLYTIKSGDASARGAAHVESGFLSSSGQAQPLMPYPMSIRLNKPGLGEKTQRRMLAQIKVTV